MAHDTDTANQPTTEKIMRIRKMRIVNGQLRMETHNHDSAGLVLGNAKTDIRMIRSFAASLTEPSAETMKAHGNRTKYLQHELRNQGLI